MTFASGPRILSWLAVQAHAEAAKGDLRSRSDSPSWLSVCAPLNIFLCSFQRHTRRGIPQDRDCLTVATTGGVETSKNIALFFVILWLKNELCSEAPRLVVWRVGEKARSPSYRQRNRCLGLFSLKLCTLLYECLLPCHCRTDSGAELSSFHLGHS